MKKNKIVIGPMDAPVLEFYNDNILEIVENTSVSMVGSELAIDQLTPVVRYDLYIKYQLVPADIENYQRFITADGYILCGYYNYDIRAIPYGTEIRFFIDDRPAGLYYLQNVQRLSRDSFKLSCVSAVGMMDKQRHVGKVYSGERFDAVLAELLGEGYDYIIDPEVAELQVYGWLPYGTKRSNLHQLLVAYGVTIIKSDTGGMLFTFLKATDGTAIPLERIYDEGSVVYGEQASLVEILEHGYYYLPTAAYEVLFDTKGESVEDAVVVFDMPIYPDSITVDAEGNLQILESGTNYARVTGSGVLSGQPYVHTTKLITATNEEAPTEKIVSVEDATLITLANSENCLKRISEFYFRATTVRNSIVLETERTGKRYLFYNPFMEYTSAFMTNMSAFTSNVTKAECEWIQDYVPIAQGSSFLKREILELSEDGAVWNIPDSVYQKDTPTIRIVLIGAGYDGAAGEDGGDGEPGNENDGGLGGPGGEAGKAGKGGRIISATIDVTNLAFIRYGADRKNTWVKAGERYYSSASGVSSPTGFVEMFTGAVYALPGSDGTDGAPGGKGGSYPPIAAAGTANAKAEAGGDVEYNGTTYKGGKSSSRAIIKGADVTSWIHDNMNLYFGGAAGGGAAVGSNGADAKGAALTEDKTDLTWDEGGAGADAQPASPTTPMYGTGGNGGHGGGGGGGASNVHWWNHAYTTLIGVENSNNLPGKRGKGSDGTPGYRGCIIIYY